MSARKMKALVNKQRKEKEKLERRAQREAARVLGKQDERRRLDRMRKLEAEVNSLPAIESIKVGIA